MSQETAPTTPSAPAVDRAALLFGFLTHGEPEEHWTGTEILARLDCKDAPWAHLRLDEGGWCHVIEDGDMGAMCFETITHYVILPNVPDQATASDKHG